MVGLVGVQTWRRSARAVASGEIEDGSAREAELLRAGQAGDQAALEQLLTPYERPLYALCRGILGHADDAEDAVQETFLRALRALPTFRGDSAVRSWLYRIAVNICLDRKRAARPTEPWDEEQCPAAAHSRSPERIAVSHLRVLEGWSVAEIAVAMRWKEKRVYNELYRARLTLADWRRREAVEGDER
jgi:DNA-directed RNA polymerase specialized sigma24 family protein